MLTTQIIVEAGTYLHGDKILESHLGFAIIQTPFLAVEVEPEMKFLKSLLKTRKLHQCDLLFINPVKHSLREETPRDTCFKSLSLKSSSNLTWNQNLESSENPETKKRWNVGFKKYEKLCQVVVLFVIPNQADISSLTNQLSTKIMTKFYPITRRNEDYYIFFTVGKVPIPLVSALVTKISLLTRVHFNEITENVFPKLNQLSGKNLRISLATGVQSRIALKNVSSSRFKYVRGLYAFMIPEFEKRLNTSIPFPAEGTAESGNLRKDGSWSGVMGDVVDDKADIGFCAGINWLRYQYNVIAAIMEFVVLTFTTGKQPPEFPIHAIFLPFTLVIWILMTISIFFGCVITWMLMVSRKQTRSIIETNKYDMFEFIMSALFEKAVTIRGSLLLRNFCTFWSLMGLIVATLYKGKVVGMLAFPYYPPTPKNFNELGVSDFNWGLQFYGGLAYDLFRLSTNPTFQHLASRMEFEKNEYKCYEKARTSKYGKSDISASCISDGVYEERV
ncbi:unnamed protein product [Allacma fusca]|uniref:Uncharacterized protein n=1 Tax=Allacma fusca TaxID=39272 RepID=A0A8J2K849_9HEXA|nr:unnamed protein product [Allacma fusca]